MSLAWLYALAWEPEIRGITSVLIAVLVLGGSVWLLLATNVGARLGMLLSLAGLFGWMTIMGSIWWVYGIGLKGQDAEWKAVEIVYGDVSASSLEVVREGTQAWTPKPADDPDRAQAQAAADTFLVGQGAPFASATEYEHLDAFERGGETIFLTWKKPQYAIVQVQAVVPQFTEPGAAPPRPVVDENQPVISVVMLRDLGDTRLPPALITIASLIAFLLTCWALHLREKHVAENLRAADEQARGTADARR